MLHVTIEQSTIPEYSPSVRCRTMQIKIQEISASTSCHFSVMLLCSTKYSIANNGNIINIWILYRYSIDFKFSE